MYLPIGYGRSCPPAVSEKVVRESGHPANALGSLAYEKPQERQYLDVIWHPLAPELYHGGVCKIDRERLLQI
ncbi:MAG: hypothetical protein OXH03_06970 [Bacteroidetes bacterium]|nr:hypothetical protein [Bacteroidota bacterium]MDE2671832.1 hypothetical protein [Bacteroidota bacterium]